MISTTTAPDPPAPGPHYLFVGGKGGVGKTTCAAAMALNAASRGARTLVVSTDPAPSLGDAFIRPLGPAPRRIPTRRGSLHAVEVDSPAALRRWLANRRAALERIALRGTWLDEEDVSRLLQLSLPGIDELAALLEVSRLTAGGTYDVVIVDTAPTGHTLRMLDTPGMLGALAAAFDSMQEKHRAVVQALRGRWSPDREDVFIREMSEESGQLASLLRNRDRARFCWITLPEMMAVEETADAVSELGDRGLEVHDVIVNRITSPPERPCGWCDARRSVDASSVGALRQRLPAIDLTSVAVRDAEPRGVRALTSIGAEIESGEPPPATLKRRGRATERFRPKPTTGVAPRIGKPGTQLLLFGGKGGVGKTTCAAAAAVAIALESPARRVLLVSTDPAHSLADALAAPVADAPRPLHGGPSNLVVREIDAARAFRAARQRYGAAIDLWFDRLVRGGLGSVGVDASYDRRVVHGLMDLAPPGIDELTAVMDVLEPLETGHDRGPDLIVMDTAPSGHALRLLDMPQLVQDWARALMSILLKYQPITGVGELGAVLLRISQGIGRVRTLLTDPAKTSFIAVTRAAALPREETLRLLVRLNAMQIDVPLVLINAVGRGTCTRCRAAAREERLEIRRVQRFNVSTGQNSIPVVVTPTELPPPRGIPALRRWRSSWRTAVAERPLLW